jgi:hypothetical protein
MDKRNSPGKNDGDKALWDLLGLARKTKVGPMFSRNVLREIRLLDQKSSPWETLLSLFQKPVILVGAAAVILFTGLILLQNQGDSVVSNGVTPQDEYVESIDPAKEFESIEILGELMAVSDPALLSDEALMNLLF